MDTPKIITLTESSLGDPLKVNLIIPPISCTLNLVIPIIYEMAQIQASTNPSPIWPQMAPIVAQEGPMKPKNGPSPGSLFVPPIVAQNGSR